MPRMLLFNLLGVIGATIALFCGGAPAMAQAGLVGTPVAVCVAPISSAATARDAFASTQFDCTTPQNDLGTGDYWVRSAALSATGPLNVRVASLWQQRLTLYAAYADGRVVRTVIDNTTASRHIQLGAIIEQPLPTRAAPLVRLLWRVDGSANMRGIVLGAALATPPQSARSNVSMGALYAAFVGLCTALLVYNLALWGALRHRFQLAYCAMLLALTIYAVSSSGALAWWFPAMPNNDRMRINYVSLALCAVAALTFARTFFEPRVFAGGLARASTIMSVTMLVTALLFALLAPWHIALLDRLYMLAFVGQMAIVGPIMWRAWRMRSNYLWLFAIAWSAPIVLACFRVASALALLRWSFWLDNSTILAMTMEALLSSLAIAYRIRLLSVERDQAREQEIAARLLADIDPLTGLLNRRAFLDRAIGREGEHLLLIADLDHFKAVNDTIGHDGGDEVLRVFARTLRQSVPPEALVARIGGEEFAVVTPGDLAIEPAEILARLRTGRMPYDLSVTASIGTCSGPLLRETDWKALYASADRALFEAKSAGRDRVRAHSLTGRLAA